MAGEEHHLGVVDDDGVLLGAPLLGVVQVDAVDGLLGLGVAAEHHAPDAGGVGSGDVQQARGVVAVQLKHGSHLLAMVNPAGFCQQRNVGRDLQVVAAVDAGGDAVRLEIQRFPRSRKLLDEYLENVLSANFLDRDFGPHRKIEHIPALACKIELRLVRVGNLLHDITGGSSFLVFGDAKQDHASA